jgi:hypothetical protein
MKVTLCNTVQTCVELVRAIRSQKLYPVELQALLNFRFSISDLRLDTEVIDFWL